MSALDWLLATSWQAAALVLVLLLAGRLLGDRLPPRWRYRLWWLVVLRLVLPPLSLPGHELPPTPSSPAPAVARAAAPGPATRPDPGPSERPAPLAGATAGPRTETATDAAGDARPVDASGESLPLEMLLIAAWIAGGTGIAVAAIAGEVRLLRRIRAAPPCEDPGILALVERGRRAAGVRRPVGVAHSTAVPVPALTGILRPVLLLPRETAARLSPAELRDVVGHEMEHLRRRDGVANWLLFAVLCLHWMNPLAWIAMARLRADRETVRDLDALRRDPARDPREYGRTILSVATSPRSAARPALVTILESRSDLRRRIDMIVRHARRPARGAVISGLLALLLLGGLLVLASRPAPADPPRPRILVTGFEVTGELLERDSGLPGSLEVLTEAILAPTFAPVAGPDLKAACERLDAAPAALHGSPDLRLAVAADLGVEACVTGWACSFGNRVVLIVEVIDPSKGLPGEVFRKACPAGVEMIPETLEALLDEAMAAPDAAKEADPSPAEEADAETAPAAAGVRLPSLPEDDLLATWPNDAYRRLVEIHESARDGTVPVETAAVAGVLRREALEHARRLREDPGYKAAAVVRGNVRRDPALSRFDAAVVHRPPYLLFVEKGEGAVPAGEYAAALGRLAREFGDRFLDGAALPAGDAGILRVFVFTRPDSMREYQEAIRQPLPAGVTAYYSTATRWLILDASGAGEAVPPKLLHEGFHQVAHAHARAEMERIRGEEILFTDPALRSGSLWLHEGLAELFAAAYPVEGGEWDFAATSPRLETIRMLEERKLATWSLEDLLRARRSADLFRGGAHMAPAFYAQAWAFSHFLWNGGHRDALIEAFRRDLRGESGFGAFREVWARHAGVAAEEIDWSALQEELDRHVAGL